MNLLGPAKAAARALLKHSGYRLRRFDAEELRFRQGYDERVPLPPGAEEWLRTDHPHLLELEQRYARVDSPICAHTQWRSALQSSAQDLLYFRGENVYLWQYLQHAEKTQSHADMRGRFYVYARYVRELDHAGLLGAKLTEDGAFGCFAFHYPQMPSVSRDLLDSINELYFIDRHCPLFGRRGLRVLDIGAGYGRLAHRMLAAVPGVERYWCVDAIPRSTFLCEYYLRHRGFAGQSDTRAVVVPLDERAAIPTGAVDLAVNIHSFSEMSLAAIRAWLDWLAELRVPTLLVVPNEPKMLSREADGSRREYRGLIEQAGFDLSATEPTLNDPDVASLYGACDHYFLFRRR